ncbi:MAG: hypothetical protein R3321_10855, partial [Nitrososphaeraceae archaeon]|nr:hypothetical protein [Nitrososphaeraceae archaeon]
LSIYNKEITDADGLLYVELIPFPSKIYGSPVANSSDIVIPGVISKMKKVGTQSDFMTWGFLDNSTTPNCLKGILHIMGPVLVDFVRDGFKIEKPYSLTVQILAEKNNSLIEKGYKDTFIIPNK